MTRKTAWGLKVRTKFNRDLRHLERLHKEGRQVAEQWLAGWRALGKDFDAYPEDARYSQPE